MVDNLQKTSQSFILKIILQNYTYMPSHTRQRKTNHTKKNREFIVTVSMFLLGQETLRTLFWTVKSVQYQSQLQKVRVGISTTDGKYGTTLNKLRKTARGLSDFLYEQGLTFRQAHIEFFIDTTDEDLVRMNAMLDTIDTQTIVVAAADSVDS